MPRTAVEKRTDLRAQLESAGLVIAPGAYDAIMARLIEQNDFRAIHITGGGISRSMGYPDVGLLTMTEMVTRIGYIARSVDIPVIADADTGYGNVVNVKRAVEELEAAGAAAIHIEDEQEPKKCVLLGDVGHDVHLIPIEEMVAKLKAAQAARSDPNFMIVARVCATGDRDFKEVLRRGTAYAEAGADAVFLIHLSPDQLAEACEAVPAPVAYNATHHASWVRSFEPMNRTFSELEEMGLKICIMSSSVALGGIIGMQKLLDAVKQDGSVFRYFDGEEKAEAMSRFYSVTGAPEVQEWEKRFLPTARDPSS